MHTRYPSVKKEKTNTNKNEGDKTVSTASTDKKEK
jgi:hypothetical protein